MQTTEQHMYSESWCGPQYTSREKDLQTKKRTRTVRNSAQRRTHHQPRPSRFAEPLLLCRIAAPPTQRLVPTRRWRGWDNKRVASGVEMSHICTRKKKHQLVVAQPTNTEDDANLFSRMSNRNTTLRPRARLQSSLSCAWPNLSRVLLPLTFNTILHETAGHQAAPTLLPQIREASLTQRFARYK